MHPTKNNGKIGMPDFECSNDRYVEVKTGKLDVQLKAWAKLNREGKEVYLLNVYETGYSLHRIEVYIDEPHRSNIKEKLTCRICKAQVDCLWEGNLCEKCKDEWKIDYDNLWPYVYK